MDKCIIELSDEYPDPNEFLSHMKLDLYEDEVFCLTPKGDVITLPQVQHLLTLLSQYILK